MSYKLVRKQHDTQFITNLKMHKSTKLIEDLKSNGAIFVDEKIAQQIIRDYFCSIHKEAVSSTVIACHQSEYKEVQFFDK